MTKDRIYAAAGRAGEPFRFDAAVADVFPDMLRRSIPGYAASLEAIGALAARFVRGPSACYDLGCSLGAASLAMRQGIRVPGCRIVAVDNAPAMLARAAEIVDADDRLHPSGTPIELVDADVRDLPIDDASMVVMNYTLQFLPVADRDAVLGRVFRGLRPGGLFLLSEKVTDDDPRMERLLVDLHHEHKRRNDYSAREIRRKRDALENVLVPETVDRHVARLHAAGFAHAAVWLRYFNFVSIVAIRAP